MEMICKAKALTDALHCEEFEGFRPIFTRDLHRETTHQHKSIKDVWSSI